MISYDSSFVIVCFITKRSVFAVCSLRIFPPQDTVLLYRVCRLTLSDLLLSLLQSASENLTIIES